jgi:hypothetical protein
MFHFDYKEYSFWCDIGMMTPKQYIKMIDLLEKYKPKRICELGSGQSTEIFEVYAKKMNAELYSIEHDIYYNTHKNNVLIPLIENSQLTVRGKTYDKCSKYDGFEKWIESQDKFDFVLIDAPNDGIPTNEHNLEYARIQMLDFVLLDKLCDKSIVMYHDSERNIAQNTLNEFERLLAENGFFFQKEDVIENDIEIIDYNRKVLGTCPILTTYKINKILKQKNTL